MLKKVGVLALMLTAVGLLFHPANVSAADFDHGRRAVEQQKTDARFVREDREPVARREVRGHDRWASDRGRDRDRRETRTVIERGDFCR
ncbi:MAG: hypothetical protein JOY54_07835 [Acidobacteriaceae bacterium]|nr:hypothetical protein [Acidobacteriaceae bacterium]